MRNWRIGIFMLVCFLVATGACFGTALTAAKNTPSIIGSQIQLTVKDAEIIYAGSLVSVDTNGEAVASTDSASDQVVGRAHTTVDNTDDGETIDVDVGIFGWVKSGTIGDSSIGSIAYVIDDQTCAITNPGNACIAGVVVEQSSDYVFVSTKHLDRTALAATTLSASGAVTFSTTLAVTGVATFTAQSVHNGGIDVNEDVDVDFNATDEEVNVSTSVNPDGSAGAGMVTLYDAEDANGANSAYMLRIARKNDAGANNEFILCEDNSSGAAGNGDDMFAVDAGGAVTAAGAGTFGGTLTASSALTVTAGAVTLPYANKTAGYTNALTDVILSYNTSAVTTNLLPEASTALGHLFCVSLQDDDGDLVVMTDGTDKFDGTNDILTFAAAGDSCWLMATAANVYTILVNVGGTLSN